MADEKPEENASQAREPDAGDQASEATSLAENAASNETRKKATENANVIWRGDKEPPAKVKLGMLTIRLPDADQQRAGFFSEHAKRLVINIPGFKFLKPKG